jgi:hypothetical protein
MEKFFRQNLLTCPIILPILGKYDRERHRRASANDSQARVHLGPACGPLQNPERPAPLRSEEPLVRFPVTAALIAWSASDRSAL